MCTCADEPLMIRLAHDHDQGTLASRLKSLSPRYECSQSRSQSNSVQVRVCLVWLKCGLVESVWPGFRVFEFRVLGFSS
jgi:hypothetical protein